MKNIILMLVLAGCLLAGACAKHEAENPQAGGTAKPKEEAKAPASGNKEVNVYMYSEYIGPELLERFKTETGITVRLSPYETTEDMLAKIDKGGGVSQYDVVVASDHIIPVMNKLKLLAPLDPAKLPNLKNLDKQFANPPYDPGCKVSVPYQWGTMGIIYRKDKIPQFVPTWALFFDPSMQPGPFVLNDSMRDTMAAALLLDGKSVSTKNPAELKRAGDLILTAKKSPKCLGFDGGTAGKNKVAAGQAALAIVYNGDAVRAIEEDKSKNLVFALPREGTEIWVDAMTIPAKAPNPEAAYLFINFILEAKAGAELSNYNRYATPNAASLPLIKEEDRKNPAIYPGPDEMKKMQYLEDIGEATKLYDEVWTTVKSR